MTGGPCNLPKRCVIVADDLTGACDSALQFRRHGARALVHLNWKTAIRESADIDAFSTDSRNLNPFQSSSRIRELAQNVREFFDTSYLIFKKIDSLLRGSPGTEIVTAMDAFGCDLGIVTPSFPEMGRTVVDGQLHVDGDESWSPIDVIALLRSQGLESCSHVTPKTIADALGRGARYLSVESASNEDLRVITSEAIKCGRKILWAGSAGLAGALAELLFSPETRAVFHMPGKRPVLFCMGSQHPVTAAQIKNLKSKRPVCLSDAKSATGVEVASALAYGQHVILQVDVGEAKYRQIRDLVCGVAELMEAVVVSGGDTLALFCYAMQCGSIEIEDQIVAGFPWGVFRGGLLDGLTIATKSGAFGAPDDLIKAMDFFTCSKN